MTNMDKNLKQVYDATLAMISKLHFKLEALSQEEMYFLLSLLDLVVMGEGEKDLLDCLKNWQVGKWNEEINEIIKASLVMMDFNDPISIKQTQLTISDLLAYQSNDDAD